MHRCVCSTRALEVFVRDVAGLRHREQRARQFLWRSRNGYKAFGTSTRLRRAEAEKTGNGSAFVPFSGEEGRKDMGKADGEENAGLEEKEGGAGGDEGLCIDGNGGWHAEVEEKVPEAGLPAGREEGSKLTGPKMKAAEAAEWEQGARDVQPGTSTSPPLAQPTSTAAYASSASPADVAEDIVLEQEKGDRAASRLQRKQRRHALGTFRPKATSQEPADPEEQDVEARLGVLDMIEKLEGPRVRTPREQKERKEKKYKKAGKDAKPAGKQDSTTKDKSQTRAEADPSPKPKKEPWQVQKAALQNKFGAQTWAPPKRLSPDTLSALRHLHTQDPETYSTATLAAQFEVSPESIRRILRSKWRPKADEEEDRRERWERRGVRKWETLVQQGVRPPKRWRELGVGSLKGEPEGKPAWKRGGRRKAGGAEGEGERASREGGVKIGLGERIL